jgi:hypothetical protein
VVDARAGRDRRARGGGPRAAPRGRRPHPPRAAAPPLGRRALPAPRDLRSGELVHDRAIGSLGPLLDPDLPLEIASALAAELASPHFQGPEGRSVASSDLRAPAFDRRRYWRGPVWVNLNWLLARGLRAQGLDAAGLEATTLELVRSSGMREYFDPLSGESRGADDFSWTAALVLDLLAGA